jgi:hypothetical protein
MNTTEIEILRDLAQRYVEICHKDAQDERRALWRTHNSLNPTLPPIYVRAFAWREMPESQCQCEDPFFQRYENFFRESLFRDTFDDDFIFEPWVTVNAAWITPQDGLWGLPIGRIPSTEPRGSWKYDPPLKAPEDIAKLAVPHHAIDEKETARRVTKLQDATGDIITVNVDRGPAYRQVMWDMMDRPSWLHGLLATMRDGILRTHEEAEQAGDWTLCAHQNQAMPYAEELADPAANVPSATRDKLWYYAASQEYAQVGPKMFDEFMLQYQIPIMAEFGLVAYGCCEDLTHKIGVGFDPDRIRRILRRDLKACKDCHVDITLKDVETVQHDPDRVRNWVKITREVIEEIW